jgi:hypothetical protein
LRNRFDRTVRRRAAKRLAGSFDERSGRHKIVHDAVAIAIPWMSPTLESESEHKGSGNGQGVGLAYVTV